VLEEVYAAARSAGADEQTAAEITRRVLLARPAQPEALAARLAAGRAPAYASLAQEDRDAIVLARALGWKADHIADHLEISRQDVMTRLARGLRTLRLRPDCGGAASPAHAAHAS
jgi:DNA-directed RNA polymerase specialized sigma24 family protein